MAGKYLDKISRHFGRPPTRILSRDEEKAENILKVIRNMDSQLLDMPFIKLHSTSIEGQIIFNPGQAEAEVSKKIFGGFSRGNEITTLNTKVDLTGNTVQSMELMTQYIKRSQRMRETSEQEVYLRYYEKVHNFDYIESFPEPRSVLNTEFSNFTWTNCSTENVGIEGDHPGINKPWLFVGQPKSFFPWHLEDGNLQSINIMLQGSPKYWFGVRNSDIEEVEKILRKTQEAANCPTFFRHKGHYIDLRLFYDKKIPIFSCIQEPGDIILTNSFHQGFNNGFNVNWAINVFAGTKLEYSYSHRGSHCPPAPACKYPTKSNFMNQVYNVDLQIKCPITGCLNKPYQRSNSLRIHLKNVHGQKLPDIVGKCPICKAETKQPDTHLVEKHKDELPKVWCTLCRVKFGNKKSLEEHYKENHESKGDYKCRSCPVVGEGTFEDVYNDHDCINDDSF